jgi:hypothetical protein
VAGGGFGSNYSPKGRRAFVRTCLGLGAVLAFAIEAIVTAGAMTLGPIKVDNQQTRVDVGDGAVCVGTCTGVGNGSNGTGAEGSPTAVGESGTPGGIGICIGTCTNVANGGRGGGAFATGTGSSTASGGDGGDGGLASASACVRMSRVVAGRGTRWR